MKFSVLMSVYAKEDPLFLKDALESVVDQTVKANEIIIVEDGPLTEELNEVLDRFQKKYSVIKRYPLKENIGLGGALNFGIQYAENELIARMDTDDIAVKNRFELQLQAFAKEPKLGIIGGHVAEFVDTPDVVTAYRKVPLNSADIHKFARRRSPFNHPTVMYKKSVIQQLDGYDSTAIRIEDYDLWLRALSSDVLCVNLDVTLLKYRANPEAIKRRKSFSSLKSHVTARRRFYKSGYISYSDLAYGITTQIILYFLPVKTANRLFQRIARDE